MRKYISIFVFSLAMTVIANKASGLEQSDYTKEEGHRIIASYIDWFHTNVNPSRSESAKEIIPYILRYSEQYKVDPLLVACLISLESSWRPRDGTKGEAGYMQVMRNKWSRKFDLDTPDGQVHAGIARLALAFEECVTVAKALTHYGSGGCVSQSERTHKKIRYRVWYYKKMSRVFGN